MQLSSFPEFSKCAYGAEHVIREWHMSAPSHVLLPAVVTVLYVFFLPHRSYSYFIEVSMDELDWIRVIDHSHYLCRSWQKLYFPARVCR